MIDAEVSAAIRRAVRAERGRVVAALRQVGYEHVQNGNDENGWALADVASLIEQAGAEEDETPRAAFRAKAHAQLAGGG